MTYRLRLWDGRKRRDGYDIVAEILESAKSGAKKTHIMNKAKLSYAQTEEYLPLLIEKGLLEHLAIAKRRHTTHFFKTSDSGRKFLENIRTLEI